MAKPKKENLAEAIRERFAALGGVELELSKRDWLRLPTIISNAETPEGLRTSRPLQVREKKCKP
jgi:hypothetical protein